MPNFKEEERFIYWDMFREHTQNDYFSSIWIDCSLKDGEWVYSDSTPCEYNAWGLGEPDDRGSCAVIIKIVALTYWKVSSCDDYKFSVCESAIEAVGNPQESPDKKAVL